MIVVSKEDQLGAIDVAQIFFRNTFGAQSGPRALAAFMAISSLGNIIVMTFTAARVKQEIAKEGVLPWPKFFGENSNIGARIAASFSRTPGRDGSDAPASDATPIGALVLHWVFTMILIVATWGQTPSTSYKILVSLYSYA